MTHLRFKKLKTSQHGCAFLQLFFLSCVGSGMVDGTSDLIRISVLLSDYDESIQGTEMVIKMNREI